MKVYEFEYPDGRVVEIEAPSEQAAWAGFRGQPMVEPSIPETAFAVPASLPSAPYEVSEGAHSPRSYAARALEGAIGGGGLGGFGGPVSGVVGALAGAGGNVYDEWRARQGAGALSRFGEGMAADLAISAVTRRPAAGLLRRFGSAVEDAPGVAGRSVARRAHRLLDDAPEVGEEGMETLMESVPAGYRRLEKTEKTAWDAARRENLGVTGDATPLHQMAEEVAYEGRFSPSEVPELVSRVRADLGPEASVKDVQDVLHAIANIQSKAAYDPTLRPLARNAMRMKGAADEVLDAIEGQGDESSQAVKSLREARSASAAKHAAAPTKSAVYKAILGENAYEEPGKAAQAIFNGKQPVTAIRQIRELAGDTPETRRALHRIGLARMLGRLSGSEGTNAPHRAGAALNKLSADREALVEIFGERGYKTYERILSETYARDTKGRKWNSILTLARSGLSGPSLSGGAAGLAVGSPSLAGAGILAGTVIDAVQRRYGRNAVLSLAMDAAVNRDTMRKLARSAGVKEGEVLAKRLVESALRRGVLTSADLLRGDEVEE